MELRQHCTAGDKRHAGMAHTQGQGPGAPEHPGVLSHLILLINHSSKNWVVLPEWLMLSLQCS